MEKNNGYTPQQPDSDQRTHTAGTPSTTLSNERDQPTYYWDPNWEGLVDGALKIDEDHLQYPQYIEAFFERKELEVKIARTNNKLDETRLELQETQNQEALLKGQYAACVQRIAQVEKEIEELAQQRKALLERLEQERKEIVELKPEFGWLVALLFIMAGGVFIATDFAISRDIFKAFLNMPENEAKIMAAGLALTSFAVKPLVDRFLEKKFQQGIWKPILYTLVGTTFFLVVMLGASGYYRIDALQTHRQLENQRDKLEALQKKSTDITYVPTEEDLALTTQLQEEISILEQNLLEDPAILIVFVLSSVLFVIVGAICFSIGFSGFRPHARKFTFWTFKMPLRKLTLKKLVRQRDRLQEAFNNLREQQEALTQRIAHLKPVDTLREELVALEKLLTDLYHEYFERRKEANQALYRTAFERGLQYELSSKPYLHVTRIMTASKPANTGGSTRRYISANSTQSKSEGETERKKGKYLHQIVREKIAKNSLPHG